MFKKKADTLTIPSLLILYSKQSTQAFGCISIKWSMKVRTSRRSVMKETVYWHFIYDGNRKLLFL